MAFTSLSLEYYRAKPYCDILKAMSIRCARKRIFARKGGYIGLGPADAQIGDVVVILVGCNVPVILRPSSNQWRFVGESYVAGIMDGELIPPDGSLELDTPYRVAQGNGTELELELKRILLV
jgi:hypothetical protein